MSDTLIENLFAAGDTPTGQFARVIAGTDANGKVRQLSAQFDRSLDVSPGLTSGTIFRFRGAEPFCLFDGKSLYAKDTVFWNESTSGSGTSTFNTNGIVRLSCTTTNGDSAIRQSKPYIPYQTGKSLLAAFGAVMGAIKANVRQRIGYFDANNGFFFEQDGTNLKVVFRTNISGAAVDTVTLQSSWNVDKLDGTGISGVTLDTSKFQSFFIDMAWGEPARFGFIIGGTPIVVHQTVNANANANIGTATPALPLRFEITNTGVAGTSTNLDVSFASAFSEGGFELAGLNASADNGSTGRSITNGTSLPILSVRLKSAYTRGILLPNHFQIFQTAAHNLYFKIVIGGTVTGGAWGSVSTAAEVNITATSFSGGTTIRSGYVVSGSSPTIYEALDAPLLASSDFAGTTADPITIQITDLANSGSSTVLGALGWREII